MLRYILGVQTSPQRGSSYATALETSNAFHPEAEGQRGAHKLERYENPGLEINDRARMDGPRVLLGACARIITRYFLDWELESVRRAAKHAMNTGRAL